MTNTLEVKDLKIDKKVVYKYGSTVTIRSILSWFECLPERVQKQSITVLRTYKIKRVFGIAVSRKLLDTNISENTF